MTNYLITVSWSDDDRSWLRTFRTSGTALRSAMDAGAQPDPVCLTSPEHVEDVTFCPDRERVGAEAGSQDRRFARGPDPQHVLSVRQLRRGVVLGGPSPVAIQELSRAVGDRLPAGGRAILVGDRWLAERDLFASLSKCVDGQRIRAGWRITRRIRTPTLSERRGTEGAIPREGTPWHLKVASDSHPCRTASGLRPGEA